MKYKGALISDLSGRVGGLVASHNSYGTYLRRHVKPVNPKTPAQQEQRAAVAAVAQSWRQLDPSVQASWSAAGIVKTSRKGDRVTLSGSNAFSYINILRFRSGLPLITSPPTDPTPCSLTLPTISFTSNANHVTVDFTGTTSDTWQASGGVVNFSAALITSPGVTYKKANRAMAQLLGPQSGSEINVALPFAVPIGGTVRLELHASDPTGRQSNYRTIDVINNSFIPPTPAASVVLSVTKIADKVAIWKFATPVAGVEETLLLVNLVGGTVLATIDSFNVAVTYAATLTTGQTWSIANPSATTPPAVAPQYGLLL